MTNSNAMTNYFIVGGLLIVPFIGWLLVKEQFTGGKSKEEMDSIEQSDAIQQGLITGGKRRRKTKRQRHYKNQSIRK